MKLPGWFRAATGGVADGVRDVRLSADGQTLHLYAYAISMPDVGDMVTVWQLRSVDLRTGWVDVARYQRESDHDEEQAQAHKDFWPWVEARTGGTPLQPLQPAPVPWQLFDPDESDTKKSTKPAFRDGLRIYRNERLRDGKVSLLRDGQVIDTHALAGATSVNGGDRQVLWVGRGPQPGQALVIGGAMRPSVLVLDVESGLQLLHTRI
jgi:hypothetical protein